MVRLDRPSKRSTARAARLRGLSTSDYVRLVAIAQARREVEQARSRTLTPTLSAEQQLAFWRALQKPGSLTQRQRSLGRIMRGER